MPPHRARTEVTAHELEALSLFTRSFLLYNLTGSFFHMETKQVIYPTERLLANPRVFMAIANEFDGPDWETFRDAFYDLIESEFEDNDVEPVFNIPEVCFRVSPDDETIFQVVLTNGMAIELRPQEGDSYSLVKNENELGVVSAIYGRLVKAIEEARPDLKGDISLTDIPTLSNDFLRDEHEDCFRGTFSLLSDSDKTFKFKVDIIDLAGDDLKATVEPA